LDRSKVILEALEKALRGSINEAELRSIMDAVADMVSKSAAARGSRDRLGDVEPLLMRAQAVGLLAAAAVLTDPDAKDVERASIAFGVLLDSVLLVAQMVLPPARIVAKLEEAKFAILSGFHRELLESASGGVMHT